MVDELKKLPIFSNYEIVTIGDARKYGDFDTEYEVGRTKFGVVGHNGWQWSDNSGFFMADASLLFSTANDQYEGGYAVCEAWLKAHKQALDVVYPSRGWRGITSCA